ncbi:MAG: hypothetical protein M3680_30560 [Myxococcota bacterium]|nr:hypothetical protein [Myxococcota bacterium]
MHLDLELQMPVHVAQPVALGDRFVSARALGRERLGCASTLRRDGGVGAASLGHECGFELGDPRL